MLPKGAKFGHFRAAGMPVTFAHQYDRLPVGRGIWIKQEKEKGKVVGWLAKTQYHERPADHPEGAEWFPDSVWALIKGGNLRGKSIGFIPLAFHTPTPEEIKQRPELADVVRFYDEYELLEWAVAPIQSNPDALIQAVAKAAAEGVVIPESLLAECGVVLPAPVPEITPGVLSKAEPDTQTNEHVDTPAAATPPVLPLAQVRNEIHRAMKGILMEVPRAVRDAIAAQRGQP